MIVEPGVSQRERQNVLGEGAPHRSASWTPYAQPLGRSRFTSHKSLLFFCNYVHRRFLCGKSPTHHPFGEIISSPSSPSHSTSVWTNRKMSMPSPKDAPQNAHNSNKRPHSITHSNQMCTNREWVSALRYGHRIERRTAMRMNDLQIRTKVWKNITNIILSERNQTRKSSSRRVPLIWSWRTGKINLGC